MKYKQTNSAPTSEAEIADFEARRGVRLPESYRAFLLETNGGWAPEPGAILVPNLAKWGPMVISEVPGLGRHNPHGTIEREWLGDFSRQIGRQMIQFAHEGSGEVFVLDLRPATYGQVWVCCHDYPANPVPLIDPSGFVDYDAEEARLYHPVAPSFEAFLAMLGPGEDPGGNPGED